ncbi:MAG: type II secretion system GspH family protein [Thermodesulfovibrio sp.]|nr:type II secretion system GspH family protein [Thermodesulfovibrio sp.]
MRSKEGFTLIEILIVIAILGLMFSVTIPISYELYENYKNSLKIQDVMLYISSLKRESFLYSEPVEISSNDGAIVVNNEKKRFNELFITINQPFKFFKNGTTEGGQINIKINDKVYKLIISSPFGEVRLEKVDEKKQ